MAKKSNVSVSKFFRKNKLNRMGVELNLNNRKNDVIFDRSDLSANRVFTKI